MSLKTWRRVIRETEQLLQGLPSAEEREEAIRAIEALIALLTQVRDTLRAMPSDAEAAAAREGLAKLAEILERNPLLRAGASSRRGAGKAGEKRKGGEKKPDLQEVQEEARRRLAALAHLSEDALRKELRHDRTYTTRLLRAMLVELGRRVSSRTSREEMIDGIVTVIVNRRTYEGLRGGGG